MLLNDNWRDEIPQDEILYAGPNRIYATIEQAVHALNDGFGTVILFDNDCSPTLSKSIRVTASGTETHPLIIAPVDPNPDNWPWRDCGVTRHRNVQAGDERSQWTTFILTGDWIALMGFKVENVGTFVLREGAHYEISMLHGRDVWNDFIHSHSGRYGGDSDIFNVLVSNIATFIDADGNHHTNHGVYETSDLVDCLPSRILDLHVENGSGHCVQVKVNASARLSSVFGYNTRSYVSMYDGGSGGIYGGGWFRDSAPTAPGCEMRSMGGEALLHKSATGHVEVAYNTFVILDPEGKGPIEHGGGTETYNGNVWRVNPDAGASWDWPENYGVDPHHKFFGPEGALKQPNDVRQPVEPIMADELRGPWLEDFVFDLSDFYEPAGDGGPGPEPELPDEDGVLLEILDVLKDIRERVESIETRMENDPLPGGYLVQVSSYTADIA